MSKYNINTFMPKFNHITCSIQSILQSKPVSCEGMGKADPKTRRIFLPKKRKKERNEKATYDNTSKQKGKFSSMLKPIGINLTQLILARLTKVKDGWARLLLMVIPKGEFQQV